MPKKRTQKSVFITGGCGFIGSYLANFFLNNNYYVSIIDNLSTGRLENIKTFKDNKNLEIVIEDICHSKKIKSLIERSDVIVHLAASVGVRYILKYPVKSIINNLKTSDIILELCNKFQRKIILASSSEVYGLNLEYSKKFKKKLSENDNRIIGPTFGLRWTYAAAKILDEYLAFAYYKKFFLPVVIIRLFNVVGPRQLDKYGMVLPNFIKSAVTNNPITIFGNGKQIRTFISVYDVIRMIYKIIDNQNCIGRVINIGSDKPITIEDLAKKVKKICKSKSNITYLSYKDAYGNNFSDMKVRVPDISLLKSLINDYPKITLDKIIRDMIDQFSIN